MEKIYFEYFIWNMELNMRNNNFSLLRHFAAIGVLFRHSTHHLNINDKWIIELVEHIPGVTVFFIMSGFLLALTYDKNSDLKRYIKNRILRIYPVLYVSLFISICILYYFDFIEFNIEFFKWLLAQVSIVQIYNIEMFRGFGVGVINGSLWTINVLLTFYILLPILFLIYRKNKWIIILLFLFSFFFWVYDQTNSTTAFLDKLLHVTIVPYLFIFIMGMVFYKYFDNLKKYFEEKFLYWLILYILLMAIVNYFNIERNILLYSLEWIIFPFLVFSFSFSFKNLSNKIFNKRDYSFGIYIYHMLIINIFIHLKLYGEIKYFLYALVLTICISVLSWHFIEKPIILRFKNKSLFGKVNID